LATDWVEKVNTTAQEHLPEPIVAAGILQPAGTWGAFGVEQLSPAAAMFKRRKVNKNAGGLAKSSWKGTKTALLAVTADKLYAFAVKQKGRSWKVQDKLGVWDRSDLKIETAPGKLATKVVFDVASTGEHYELEATTVSTASFNEPFLAAL
jgi:ribosomal protein L11